MEAPPSARPRPTLPRVVEVVLALLALAVAAPIAVTAALANWVSTGRVLFRQARVGQGRRPFTMLKFQTMVDGASGRSTVTVAADPRVTPLGRLLRITKVDELPQLLNVLRGEMALVGPRALTPNEVARVPEATAARVYAVRPGMTGLSALLFADEERMLGGSLDAETYYYQVVLPRKMALESLYVARRSTAIDLLILALTPLAILAPRVVRAALARALGTPLRGDLNASLPGTDVEERAR